MSFITLNNISKSYQVFKYNEEKNYLKKLKQYFKPIIEEKIALKKISFEIEKGEIVGIIGKNGAGKSTLIKILSGIIYPTSGIIKIGGENPFQNRNKYIKNIGVVFNQKTQLWWDLPAIEAFKLFKDMYKIPNDIFEDNLKLFSKLLDLEKLIYKPVRQLSLGQRMRCEIAGAFLHNPKIVYLDEPTIGLDILAKEKIRDFIKKINQEQKVSIIITTHDMKDIEILCKRIIFLDNGKIILDDKFMNIISKYSKNKKIIIKLDIPITIKNTLLKRVICYQNTIEIEDENIQNILEFIKELSCKTKILNFYSQNLEFEDIVKELYLSKEE